LNNNLAPTYKYKFGDYWIFWYSKSNNYSVVEFEFKTLLEYYFSSNSTNQFGSKVAKIDPVSNPIAIAEKLQLYLEGCNTPKKFESQEKPEFNSSKSHIQKCYSFRGKTIQINYDSDLVKKTIHPSIAYLEVAKKNACQTIFDIYLDKDLLCLFKDKTLITAVPKRDYHLLQGKFVMQLLSVLHDKQESDWLGTFHGSTISDGENSILFIGQSGKGKSTLCTLLSAHGFELVADDVSPMLSENRHIYYNPSAISTKEGAFDLLRPLIKDFDNIPTIIFNKLKGQLKYIPREAPLKNSYPCKSIILVNYSKGADTKLEVLSTKTLLETLIPDSWVSQRSVHAKQFLDWLNETNYYRLTYSNTDSVVKEIRSLFRIMSNKSF